MVGRVLLLFVDLFLHVLDVLGNRIDDWLGEAGRIVFELAVRAVALDRTVNHLHFKFLGFRVGNLDDFQEFREGEVGHPVRGDLVGVLDDIVPFGNRETDFLAHIFNSSLNRKLYPFLLLKVLPASPGWHPGPFRQPA